MPKFRKKPVVIEAMQWDGTEECAKLIRDTLGHDVIWDTETANHGFRMVLYCSTREGENKADVGDWIIRGIEDEVYPCKPSIFAATYEPVEDEGAA